MRLPRTTFLRGLDPAAAGGADSATAGGAVPVLLAGWFAAENTNAAGAGGACVGQEGAADAGCAVVSGWATWVAEEAALLLLLLLLLLQG